MNKNIIFNTFAALAVAASLSSCGDFLDTMPDNRVEVDTEEEVKSLLVSAYPTHNYNMITEMMSDNVDDYDEKSTYTTRFVEQLYYWKDVNESNNESPEMFWQDAYINIAAANLALESLNKIAEEKGEWTANMIAMKAEAQMCRAYNHFMLVNMFAKHYNKATAAKDLGVTIMTEPEKTIVPGYNRNTVQECYDFIQKDLEEALPNVRDSYMTDAPKYHFNPQAAYAFACRFYLYIEDWKKAIDYADLVLGANPKSMLRDYYTLGNMVQDADAVTLKYTDTKENCNLLLSTGYSYMGRVFMNSSTWKRFLHSPYINTTETAECEMPWGKATYFAPMKHYSGAAYQYHIFWRCPYVFEYTDPVAGTGYRHSIFVNFSTDEALLNRAEAYIMRNEYQKACDDINLWLNNIASAKTKSDITPESVQEFYNSIDYYQWDESTPKKHLHPAFDIDEEGSVQESMLQCVLAARRIETLHTGLRWFDVKRYGIEIVRRVLGKNGDPGKLVDELKVDDERRAIQIPYKAIAVGYQANPRPIVETKD